MNRMRVLQIGKYYPPYIGGAENHLLTLVNELKRDVDVKVLVANTRFKTSIEESDGIKVCRLACLGRLFSLPLTLSLPLWLKKQKADILHFHLPNPLSVFSYLLSRPKGKVIVSYHSDIVRQKIFGPIINPFLVRFLKKASCIIVTSENLLKNSSILNSFKDRCKVIPHGIDIGQFYPKEAFLKEAEEIKQKSGSPLILFVGRLVYYKGLEFLLDAMRHVDAKLLMVGNGPLEKRLKRLSARLGVSSKVIWAGEVANDKIAPYYYACDVFVLPSSFGSEAFGIVQLEAFACGKPVVSTNLPTGVPFVNVNNKTGLIVAARNSHALVWALNSLLESQQLRKSFGENGRDRVESEFTKEKMGKRVLGVYEEALEKLLN